jgi:MoaA/NifB/PqqE/SkfB family radical SAM enzyme
MEYILLNKSLIAAFFSTLCKPAAIAIESSNSCNASCVMCARPELHRNREALDMNLFDKIIADAASNGISTFQLSFFGESLLDEHLGERIVRIRNKIPGAWIQIVTNGSLLTPEKSNELLAAGISEIRISIEGNNKEEFEQIRLGLDYNELVRNVEYLKQLRDSSQSQCRLVVTGLRLKAYPLDEDAYRQHWQHLADTVFIRNEHLLDLEEEESFFSKILPCPQLFTILPVYANGDNTICIYDWLGDQVYGNIGKQSIRQLWFAPKFTLYRLMHVLGMKKLVPYCRKCSYRPNYSKLLN